MKLNILDQNVRLQILKGINDYGGSFICAIGQAMMVADSENLKKIYEAWEDDLNRYFMMADGD